LFSKHELSRSATSIAEGLRSIFMRSAGNRNITTQ